MFSATVGTPLPGCPERFEKEVTVTRELPHQKSVILSEGRSSKPKDLRTEFLLSRRQVRRSFDSLRSLRMTNRERSAAFVCCCGLHNDSSFVPVLPDQKRKEKEK